MNINILNLININISRSKNNDFYKNVYADILGESTERILFNVGAGSVFNHPCWTNIDFISDWYKNKDNTAINYNLLSLKPLPIPSNKAKIFYTSHVIEHITDDAALNLFNEVYRCLDEKGVFRVTCPDTDLAWASVARCDDYYFEKLYLPWFNKAEALKKQGMDIPFSKMSNIQKFITQTCTARCMHYTHNDRLGCSDDELLALISDYGFEKAMEKLCSTIDYPEILTVQNSNFGFHMNWWTKSKLISFLKQSGFSKISISSYGQSVTPLLRDTSLFDNTEPKLSLYIEAYK